MTRLFKRNLATWCALAVISGAVFVAGFSAIQQAQSQAQSQQQMMPQGRMPMMGPGQGRWMWPRHGMMRGMQGQPMGPGMGPWMGRGASMVRHMYYMHNGIPPEYRGKVNPLSGSPEVVRDGAVLYADNCALCHGARGFGDGEAGKELNPPPANLAHMIRMPMLNDEYLFWTISEGGEPLGSEMPTYKDTLKAEEIWKIVAAMRAGFPSPPAETKEVNKEKKKSATPKSGRLSTNDVRTQIEQWIQWYGNPKLKVGSISEKGENTIVAEIVAEDDSVAQRIEVDRSTGWMHTIQ
jgi:mono/diheme cytochrome c family protein